MRTRRGTEELEIIAIRYDERLSETQCAVRPVTTTTGPTVAYARSAASNWLWGVPPARAPIEIGEKFCGGCGARSLSAWR